MASSFHPFHLVLASPWPVASSLGALSLLTSTVVWFKSSYHTLMLISFVFLLTFAFMWWRDVSREATYHGDHTPMVADGLKLGMSLFILSEVFFFTAWFWGYFHHSTVPAMEMGLSWPPVSVYTLDPFSVPLLNTFILLSSGVTLTYAHYALLTNQSPWSMVVATIVLGALFTTMQWVEYCEASFAMSDSTFGSLFFVTTGFHGSHVIVGVIFLISTWSRLWWNLTQSQHHVGIEMAIWYWHFVDVVWLFLFSFYYVWGS